MNNEPAANNSRLPRHDDLSLCHSIFGDQLFGYGVGCVCFEVDTTAIVCANSSFLQFLGLNCGEAIGHPLSGFLPRQDRQAFADDIHVLSKKPESTLRREFQLEGKTDTETWVQFNFIDRKSGNDAKPTISATALDISERKRLEQQLVLSIARFEMAQEHSKVGSWELVDGAVEGWWSKQLYELHCFDPAQGPPMLGDFLGRVHPEDRAGVIGAIASPLQPGREIRLEFRSDPGLGPMKYFAATIYTTEKNGNLIWNGVNQDITEQKRLHAALEESERKYREIVESAAEGICVVSPGGIILQINEQAANMLGFSPSELMGTSILEWKDSKSVELPLNAIEEENFKFEQVYETKLKHRSGSDVWVLVSRCPLLDERGEIVRVKGTLIDITHRKKIEELTRNSAIAKAKLEMLSKRERQVLEEVVAGRMNKVIAKNLDISEKTVERHRSRVMKKLSVQSVAELVRISVIAESIVQ
ncbi:Transcriptional regulatory protein FixJ [Planctomycetes bacterium CA13]|uniref:histidine kinase n=1 Tax=Novipirellula herctigrandis TaxID=2527986 RepID=A0A5C5Z164_9BACT|nr:Transcriptional regulatory protein FixJ [Planctomycetes bacterium CA13]